MKSFATNKTLILTFGYHVRFHKRKYSNLKIKMLHVGYLSLNSQVSSGFVIWNQLDKHGFHLLCAIIKVAFTSLVGWLDKKTQSLRLNDLILLIIYGK